MTKLDLTYRNLTTLDGIDLTGVTELVCSNNNLTHLPPLPDTLKNLWCWQNNLTSLPILPNSLVSLQCNYNKLVSLPYLPDSLCELCCSDNKLTSLTLPDSLQKLWCLHNNLPSIPILPDSLKMLVYYNYNLSTNELENLKLEQHNQMRTDLGLPNVLKIENSKEIKKQWIIWQYRLDGEKYNNAKHAIAKL